MNPHEEAVVRAFVSPSRRPRWLEYLADPGKRSGFLDRLNHCQDLDDRYISTIPHGADAVTLLRSRGAPTTCHVISCFDDIDGLDLPLAEAVERAASGGWGTIVGCIPGRLGYDYDEEGERRFLPSREG